MKIPYSARYGFATQKAYEFIEENLVTSLPLDPFQIAEFMDIPITAYSSITEHDGYSLEELNRIFSSEDGVSIYKDGYYYILYNDSPESIGRIHFTILHELGHIYLGHFTDFEQTALTRSQLTSSEYQVLENEVNCFARNVLAPLPVVLSLPEKSDNVLKKMFNISAHAARTRLSFLRSDIYHLTSQLMERMEKWFAPHIHKMNNTHSCMHCGKVHILVDPKYCNICGNPDLVKIENPIGVENNMIYSGVQVDNEYKPLSCPKCESESMPNGNYCQICGLHLYNKCTGWYYGESEGHNFTPSWHAHDKGCNIFLNGEARFCTDCGSTSTYLEDGVLKDWRSQLAEEEQNRKEYEETLEVPW